ALADPRLLGEQELRLVSQQAVWEQNRPPDVLRKPVRGIDPVEVVGHAAIDRPRANAIVDAPAWNEGLDARGLKRLQAQRARAATVGDRAVADDVPLEERHVAA